MLDRFDSWMRNRALCHIVNSRKLKMSGKSRVCLGDEDYYHTKKSVK